MDSKVDASAMRRDSETSPVDYLVAAFDELALADPGPGYAIEECYSLTRAQLKRHLKYVGLMVYKRLMSASDHLTLEWFEALLTVSERLSSLGKSENCLPMRQIRSDTPSQVQSMQLPAELKSHRDAYNAVQTEVSKWERDEQQYRATVVFLQEEHKVPRYFLSVELEATLLCESRIEQLELIVDTLERWRADDIFASYASYYHRYSVELKQLEPQRIIDRILSGVPAGPHELVTDVDNIRLSRDNWPDPDPQNCPKQILLTPARAEQVEHHLKDSGAESYRTRWKRYARQHKLQMKEIIRDCELLKLRGELNHRIKMRYEKRLAQLREEEAMLTLWLSKGFLHPPYGARLVDLQLEFLTLSPEKLYQEVEIGRTPRKMKFVLPEEAKSHQAPGFSFGVGSPLGPQQSPGTTFGSSGSKKPSPFPRTRKDPKS
mgnify:CR=1 FL=1